MIFNRHLSDALTEKLSCNDNLRLSEVACHEAGHAVMAVLIGRTVTCVTIVPDREQGYLGCCWTCAESETLDNCIRCSVAGPIAQRVGLDSAWRPSNYWFPSQLEGAQSDMTQVMRSLSVAIPIFGLPESDQQEMSWKAIGRNLESPTDAACNRLHALISESYARLTCPRVFRALRTVSLSLLDAGTLDGPLVHRMVANAMTAPTDLGAYSLMDIKSIVAPAMMKLIAPDGATFRL